MGEVGVVVFLLGGWTLAPRRKIENLISKIFEFFIYFLIHLIGDGHDS